MAIYKGFSTVSEFSQKKFKLTDHDLIKQDLINAFNIRRGEAVMNPNYGCIVWDSLFEPLTSELQQQLFQNLTDIINSDPRVTLDSIDLTVIDSGITFTIVINYTETNVLDQMTITFDRELLQVQI